MKALVVLVVVIAVVFVGAGILVSEARKSLPAGDTPTFETCGWKPGMTPKGLKGWLVKAQLKTAVWDCHKGFVSKTATCTYGTFVANPFEGGKWYLLEAGER